MNILHMVSNAEKRPAACDPDEWRNLSSDTRDAINAICARRLDAWRFAASAGRAPEVRIRVPPDDREAPFHLTVSPVGASGLAALETEFQQRGLLGKEGLRDPAVRVENAPGAANAGGASKEVTLRFPPERFAAWLEQLGATREIGQAIEKDPMALSVSLQGGANGKKSLVSIAYRSEEAAKSARRALSPNDLRPIGTSPDAGAVAALLSMMDPEHGKSGNAARIESHRGAARLSFALPPGIDPVLLRHALEGLRVPIGKMPSEEALFGAVLRVNPQAMREGQYALPESPKPLAPLPTPPVPPDFLPPRWRR